MELKAKVGIVVGELQQPRFLALFEPLKDVFDVSVFALNQERLVDQHGTSLRLRIFESLPDMPGYMRGLEEELANVDLIIGLETSRLATFQAVRAARKYGLPMCVVASEFHPYFYERYANIRAIQFDIVNKAERFWATSAAAANVLRLDGVPAESISSLAPVIDDERFKVSAEGRQRFRNYIGLAADEKVVLFHQDLVVENRPEEMLRALALLVKAPEGQRLRLLFAGNGAAAMDLKYKSFDLGLGKRVMFLHQDPEPFLVDLYNASDLLIQPRPLRSEFHEEIPMRILEGMACGLVPLVGAGSVAAELADGGGQVFPDDSHQALAAALRPLLNPALLLERRNVGLARIQSHHTKAAIAATFISEVRAVLGADESRRVGDLSPERMLAAIRADLGRNAERDALVRIEEALLMRFPSPQDRAALYCLKGDATYALGDIEQATLAYTEGVKLDERNTACLRGLGFASWQGHSNEEALIYFKKALALKPEDPHTMLGIGLVYRRLGLTEEALYWLERCTVSYTLAPAVMALAQICAQMPQPRHGIEVLQRVIDQIGDNHTLIMTLGQLYLASGRVAEGNEMLSKALGGTAPAA